MTAVQRLLDLVADFPFTQPVFRSAWLAALFTPLARFAFSGPTPFFLIEANTPAAGKGMLVQLIAQIVQGQAMTVATYTSDDDEIRKRITSLALAGDRLVLFDNIAGLFGNPSLDAALTATLWKDRLLGASRVVEAPLLMTWYGTGNNVQIRGDLARRIYKIRLESSLENPELRRDFQIPELLSWVQKQRSELLADALLILRAYVVAGRPKSSLPSWGSFEGWSDIIRQPLVWLDLPDPGEARINWQRDLDPTQAAMACLLRGWEQMDIAKQGLTVAEVIHRLSEPGHVERKLTQELIAAIEVLIGRLDTRRLGYKLRDMKRRNFQGRFIDQTTEAHGGGMRWIVRPSQELNQSGSCGSGSPTRPTSPTFLEEKLGAVGNVAWSMQEENLQ